MRWSARIAQGVQTMTQFVLAVLFAAAMSFLTLAASFAEAPRSNIVSLSE
ncbi:hypothetical protein [Devosia nitrariae]|uniref:Uncharacterized protein n=1 Tax=Devosia nitrariae TaxID=2071872 RepID=A0ABQ5W738_9HYPH|nr:hypothetical protein [Devosia nitrariae]GLQ55687.1 hypothetical protein GCM10010862_29460 [Devosia nitrariae]